MLEYKKIHILEGIDLNKSDKSKECDLCHYWHFLEKNFTYEPNLCSVCCDVMQKAVSFNNVAVVSIKGIHFCFMSEHDAINLVNNSVLSNKGVL